MRARLVPARALVDGEIEAWQQLAGRAVDPNPVNEPAFVLAAARHLPYGDDIKLLVAEEAGTFHGAMPVRRLVRRGMPMASTDVRRMTYLGTPLLDERGEEAMRAMLATLVRERRAARWAWAELRWLGAGQAEEMVRAAARSLRLPVETTEDFDQPFLVRRDVTREDGASPLDHMSPRHVRDYRRRGRRLAELLGGDLEVVDLAGDPRAVDEYIALEAAGRKRETGVAMVGHPGEPEYFRDMCRRFAAEGRLQVLCLRAGETTVAMQISVAAGDGLFLVKVGHNESFDRFDPGVQLHMRAVERLQHEGEARWVHVCTFGDNELLLRLYPDRRRTRTLVISLGGAFAQLALRSLPYARAGSRRLRALRRAPRLVGAPT